MIHATGNRVLQQACALEEDKVGTGMQHKIKGKNTCSDSLT
jgi:hypothetical protein